MLGYVLPSDGKFIDYCYYSTTSVLSLLISFIDHRCFSGSPLQTVQSIEMEISSALILNLGSLCVDLIDDLSDKSLIRVYFLM